MVVRQTPFDESGIGWRSDKFRSENSRSKQFLIVIYSEIGVWLGANVSAIIRVQCIKKCCKYVTAQAYLGAERMACGAVKPGSTISIGATLNDSPIRAEPRHADFLLLGGGLASATTAETLRQEGASGSIAIVGDEAAPPYHRPPLSTRYLAPDQPPPLPGVLDSDFYAGHGVTLLQGVRALGVDCAAKSVATDAGRWHYGQLLIATGVRPVALDVPGAGLAGVHYLRTVQDALALRAAIAAAHARSRRAVVIGGGFIALEMAAAFVLHGLQVTVVARRERLFDKLADPGISDYFRAHYTARGVEVLFDDVAALDGGQQVAQVLTASGRRLPCDLVGVGIGVRPELDWLASSGLALGDGVQVDEYLQSSNPHVYAAGDIANFADPVFKLRHRIEHWDNARKQGRLAARNMLGARQRYDEVPTFSCELLGRGFQFLGMPEGARCHSRIGEPESGSWACLYLERDVPRALFTTNRPATETRAIESLIRYRTNLAWARERLQQPGFALTRIPSQTALILQGGGALGAFECGVMQALETSGVQPDIVAGVSIGAFNGAIIASHPGRAAPVLREFWRRLSIDMPGFLEERTRRVLGAWQSLALGVPAFFRPRWHGFEAGIPGAWTSFYDPDPVKALLREFVDFGELKNSPVRLLVSAVDVETARLAVFDSYIDALTVDHILASGSLPPAFPWTTIDGRHYWDGGIVSNSPLDFLLERCGGARKRIIVVDLFADNAPLPANLMEVLGRRDEIVFAERIRRDDAGVALQRDWRRLVKGILSYATSPAEAEQVRQWPTYIQLMGDQDAAPDITRIVRPASSCETAGRDYDFSTASIERHVRDGCASTEAALARRAAIGGLGPNL